VGIAKAVNDSKAAQCQLEELQRHNRAMEGRGLYLAPYKRGQGFSTVRKKTSKKPKCLRVRQLTCDWNNWRNVCTSFFRGVFMRNNLPINGVRRNESGIINLDDVDGPGTHWVAYAERGDRVVYFDSFGNLRPSKELVRYFGRVKIEYNYTSYQSYNQSICGLLCLKFLQTVNNQFKA